MLPLGEDGQQSSRGSSRSANQASDNQPGQNKDDPGPKAEEQKSLIPGLPDVGRTLKGLFGR
jgi:hypothetical protein